MVENPVLEEIDETVPMLDEVEARRALERSVEETAAPPEDGFDEIILARTSRFSIPAYARSRSTKRARSPRLKLSLPAYDFVRSLAAAGALTWMESCLSGGVCGCNRDGTVIGGERRGLAAAFCGVSG